jgi:hypothetical protein
MAATRCNGSPDTGSRTGAQEKACTCHDYGPDHYPGAPLGVRPLRLGEQIADHSTHHGQQQACSQPPSPCLIHGGEATTQGREEGPEP